MTIKQFINNRLAILFPKHFKFKIQHEKWFWEYRAIRSSLHLMKRNFIRYRFKLDKSLEELVKNSDVFSHDRMETSKAIADQIQINIDFFKKKVSELLKRSRYPKTYRDFVEIRNDFKALKRTMLYFRMFVLPLMVANFDTWDKRHMISTKVYVSKMFFTNYS